MYIAYFLSFLTAVGVEVFSKQALSLSNEKYKAKGKQKRKERAIKPKSSSQKVQKTELLPLRVSSFYDPILLPPVGKETDAA